MMVILMYVKWHSFPLSVFWLKCHNVSLFWLFFSLFINHSMDLIRNCFTINSIFSRTTIINKKERKTNILFNNTKYCSRGLTFAHANHCYQKTWSSFSLSLSLYIYMWWWYLKPRTDLSFFSIKREGTILTKGYNLSNAGCNNCKEG